MKHTRNWSGVISLMISPRLTFLNLPLGLIEILEVEIIMTILTRMVGNSSKDRVEVVLEGDVGEEEVEGEVEGEVAVNAGKNSLVLAGGDKAKVVIC